MDRKTRLLMGTEITITIFWQEDSSTDIGYVFDIFSSLETEFSRFKSDSQLSVLNAEKKLKVSERSIEILKKCKEIYTDTSGYFNPLIDLRKIGYGSDFKSKRFKKEEGEVNLEREQVEIIGNEIYLKENQNLDFGGIAKWYGVDKAKEYLASKGYKDYIIDAGGDIYVAGVQENWEKIVVGVDSPFVKDTLFASLELKDKAIATSGNYKRKRKIGETEYNHIINPITWSNNNEITNISLITNKCYLGDAYATACIAMGLEKALLFLKKNHIDGIIICTNKKVYATVGMKKYNIQYC